MVLSKCVSENVLDLLSKYLMSLYSNPLRTKSLTSAVIATLANICSQSISGGKALNWNSVRAYFCFGLAFGGSVPHYFYLLLEKLVRGSSKSAVLRKLIIERLIYTPFYQFLSLYMLARLEGKNHDVAYKQMERLYWSVLIASWKYLTAFQLVNLWFVPPMMRVLVFNFIGFFWVLFLATKRRVEEERLGRQF